MSETGQPITQKQNSLIWEGFPVFRKLPEWMISARDPRRPRTALLEALELFIVMLHTWMKSKVRERNDDIFVLEHLLPAYKILNLK